MRPYFSSVGNYCSLFTKGIYTRLGGILKHVNELILDKLDWTCMNKVCKVSKTILKKCIAKIGVSQYLANPLVILLKI